ncbi:hypothetical protein ACERJO_11745 [Halalkalibacter sp. AB-rgal2]|uniref:hypothetical protein n=1 Tax=Halalkalibacter sp. AB-rgal2 TaxID=3242695 RepID=UPI00359D77B5
MSQLNQLIEMRRNHVNWSIQQNPTDISIKRLVRVKAGGGFDEIEKDVGPFTVRLYVTSGSPKAISVLAGEKQVDTYYGLLADCQSDIKADTHTTDSFKANGMEFEVKAVFPQTIGGEVTGYQCELERVM